MFNKPFNYGVDVTFELKYLFNRATKDQRFGVSFNISLLEEELILTTVKALLNTLINILNKLQMIEVVKYIENLIIFNSLGCVPLTKHCYCPL